MARENRGTPAVPDGADLAFELAVAVDGRFAIVDAQTANWVVRRILEARAYAARVKAWAQAEQRRAEREEASLTHRFGDELQSWAEQQIASQRDHRRSVSLPAGVVGFRTEPLKIMVQDEAQLRCWCKRHLPDAVRTVETIVRTPLMAHLKATGESPPGAEVAGGTSRFYVSGKDVKENEGVLNGESEEQAG